MEIQSRRVTQDCVVLDGHIDLPHRLFQFSENPAQRTVGGDFDYPRARDAGLDVAFMAAYVPANLQSSPGAANARANTLIDRVDEIGQTHPSEFAIVTTADEARHTAETDAIGLALGLENGAALEGSLENLGHFYDRGVRYITLTHSAHNPLGDSSTAAVPPRWNGLSPFGKDVVAEMNRLGIMVDVSHAADPTVSDVIARTSAPIIASHSGCRHFTPGWHRNLSDDLIEGIAASGGLVMVPFGSRFLRTNYRDQDDAMKEKVQDHIAAQGWDENSRDALMHEQEVRRSNSIGTVHDVADHIDHVEALVGIDHVGLGSDFDGVFSLPSDLQDVSGVPNLVSELLQRDYSRSDLEKLLGCNMLRVWTEVDGAATAR